MKINDKIIFKLPPEGIFKKTNDSDPLDFYYKPFVGNLYRQRIQNGLDLLDQSQYQSILEFGYGNGLLLPTLNKLSENVAGIDIYTDVEGIYKSLSLVDAKATLYKEDLCKADFSDGAFDLIVSYSVFEHIKFYDTILAELHRLLKPGGHLLIGMPRVDKFMKVFFSSIGFNEIEKYHVTNHKEILVAASKKYHLVKFSKYPFNFKLFPALYYNFLFKKL